MISITGQAQRDDGMADFDAFFLRSRMRVLGALVMLTRDPYAAEDAVQDAYHRAYRDWKRVSGLDRPDLWVLRVASNIAVSSWRKRQKESKLEDTQTTGPETLTDEAWLKWGLNNLTVKERAVVILHHAEGWPVEDVARLTHQTEGAVGMQLFRARHRLRELLRPRAEA
jgi:RNA polymerase sigma-70 factor (ECF subfamily)